MGMMKLAYINFKSSFKNYLSLVLSLAFTILVFLNFQNILASDAYEGLGTRNKEYIDMLVSMTSFVLGCFMVFFIWYSTNVFLTRRKREIGVYVFMGLSNQKIGKLYLIEITLIGLLALSLGLVLGMMTSGLFQMILGAVSKLTVPIRFGTSPRPVAVTSAVYLAIYLIFAWKGYINIVQSSVLGMISAAKQNEYVRQKKSVLFVKAALGMAVLGSGYFMAVREGRNVISDSLKAVVLVTVGVYLLFGGMIPLLFQTLAGNKRLLYQKTRVLWMNRVIFRMKKNYRTYAIVSILMLCSVTALAMGFAMKGRYETIVQFENTYTFQLLSNQRDLDSRARELIETENEIVLSTQIPILGLDKSLIQSKEAYGRYALIPYSFLNRLAGETGMELPFQEPAPDEVFKVTHPYLMSLAAKPRDIKIVINGKEYRQTGDTDIPYLGYLQESMNFYVINDGEYQKILPLGEELYTYNYRIRDLSNFAKTRDRLDELVSDTDENYTGRIAIDPQNSEIDWIRILYSICIFMFFVFIMASGSILFMKLYNDAFEEREQCRILRKMGFDRNVLEKAAAVELGIAYGLPFGVMAFSSLFSVGALGKVMDTGLGMVNVVSVAVVLGIQALWYGGSLWAYGKNTGIG